MVDHTTGSRWHPRLSRVIVFVLARSDYAELLLGKPPIRLDPESVPTQSPLVSMLVPQRRWLWRQRASLIVARGLSLSLLYVATVNILLRPLVSSPALTWAPPIAVMLASIWLGIANRPSLQETARWLDRHFNLFDQLSTALECGHNVPPGSVAEMQVTEALALARRLPPRPLDVHQLGPWTRAAVLGLVAAVSLLIGVNRTSPGQIDATSATGGAAAHSLVTPLADATLQRPFSAVPQSQVMSQLPAAAGRTGQATVTHQQLLATSLQYRPGPSLPQGSNTGAPRSGSLGGKSPAPATRNVQANTQQPAAGAAQAQNGSSTSSAAGDPSTAQQQTGARDGQAKSSTGAAASSQQANTGSAAKGNDQSLPNQKPPSSAANPQQSQANGSRQTNGSGQPTNPTSGKPAQNPFGQDPSSAAPRGQNAAPSGNGSQGSTPRQPGAKDSQPAGTGSSQGQGGSSSDASRYGQNDPIHRRGNVALPPDSTAKTPHIGPDALGPVTIKTIQVQGDTASGSGSGTQSGDLVRIVPSGAVPGQGLSGPNGTGSTVSGYVPEEDSVLTQADQAMVRAYFDSRSGS